MAPFHEGYEMCNGFAKFAVVACLGLAAAGGALAQPVSRGEWQSCLNADNDTRIAACTSILNRSGLDNKSRGSALNARGQAFGNKIQYDRAIEDFDEALHLDPRNVVFYNNRGWAFTGKGDPDRGIQDLDEALRLNPKYVMGYVNRGHAFNLKGDFDRAIQDFDKALRFDAKSAYALTHRGRAYTSKGQYDRAIQDYDAAIRLDPKLSTAWNNRGWTYNLMHKFDRGLADLNEAIRLNPLGYVSYLNRSVTFVNTQDYDRAARDLDDAIRITPNYARAFVARGQLYTLKGEHDRAVVELDRAVAADPKLASAYAARGDAYRHKGDANRALVDLDEAIRLDARMAPAYASRGLVYEQLGDSRAASDFNTALSLPPGPYMAASWARDIATEQLALLADDTAAPKVASTTGAAPPTPAVAPPAGPQLASLPPRPVPAPATAASLSRRVALVIGNSNYRYAGKLTNPTNDEADMAQALRKLGFEVVAGANLDRHGMDDAIREFGRKLEGADLALFFYAGHGLQVGGKNYLVPVDAKLERTGDLALDAVDISSVMAQMESAKRVNLVFLDACRDNPLARTLASSFATRGLTVGSGLASVQSAIGTMIVYATQPDNVALDGDGRNSPFTSALLKHIGTPNVEIGTMVRRVRADVVAATHERQVPWDHSSLIGDVVLAR
jgi:tetratricopeptide (TPR) repeat protein